MSGGFSFFKRMVSSRGVGFLKNVMMSDFDYYARVFYGRAGSMQFFSEAGVCGVYSSHNYKYVVFLRGSKVAVYTVNDARGIRYPYRLMLRAVIDEIIGQYDRIRRFNGKRDREHVVSGYVVDAGGVYYLVFVDIPEHKIYVVNGFYTLRHALKYARLMLRDKCSVSVDSHGDGNYMLMKKYVLSTGRSR